MSEGTEELISELAVDLQPVRPIPALRVAVAAVVGVWALAVGLAIWLGRADTVKLLEVWGGPPGLVFGGLGLAGVCGILAAIAASMPGHERAVRIGAGLAVCGLLLASAVGLLLFVSTVASADPGFAAHWACLWHASAAGLVPALGAAWFAARAAAQRPLYAALGAAASAAALGTVAIQAFCPFGGPAHLLMGHVLAPAVGILLLTIPLLYALRSLTRT